MPSQPTTAGIITDASGERQIPESTRADGSTRRAIKIRPGYRPPEDVELYKNRTAESFRNRNKGGVPGAEGLVDEAKTAASAAANKNAKRREARKKAAGADDATGSTAAAAAAASSTPSAATPPVPPIDPAAEREKKLRGLKKKLKQARELKNKRDDGEALLPEQIAKVIRISELIRELDALGFDSDGEPKAEIAAADAKAA
ncbi:RNA-binding protein [Grosmannia clavigera kw1407]|uniref:RNA-binding protein n=1 Tax=Grosmannia clavigera (strain kw1407 / UAMH 11150) TaxID=655863 RepID=F0XD21_GROCL|nr:RNA-binding protein [Grosmannia clavigera kw1407]EFX03732.1 RNA-binding protein [Grosmannia clavigera kw1407]